MAYPQNTYFPFYNPMYNPAQMQQPIPQMQQMAQPMPQMQPIQPNPQPAPANDMIWVLGEVEATSYPVAPGNTVTLWDKNDPTIYIKSVNAQGVPSMRILDFSERAQGGQNKAAPHECHCAGRYAPIDEFNALREKFTDLRGEFDAHVKGGAE